MPAATANPTRATSVADTDFEFVFYFDIEADAARKEVRELLTALEKESNFFAFLGNYGELTGEGLKDKAADKSNLIGVKGL